MEFKKGERVRSNELYSKVYSLWSNMNERCNNKNHPKYKNYGAKGVKVSENWKDFDKFVKDIDKIPGFSKRAILDGKITLDKDDSGEKIYSLKNVKFISRTENNKMKPNQQFKFIATKDNETYEVTNQREFCRIHKLNQSNVSKILAGMRDKVNYKGWVFKKTK